MKRYESIFITKANLPEDELAALINQFETIIHKEKGFIIKTARWGQRKLAYDINKQSMGFYVFIDYAGKSALVAELERNLKIDDRILKFLTVKKNDRITIEEIERETTANTLAVSDNAKEKEAENGNRN